MRTKDLVAHLSKGLAPVRRVALPMLAALGWLAFGVVGLGVAMAGLRHDIEDWLMLMHERVNCSPRC